MSEDKGKSGEQSSNKGQSKVHRVLNPDGSDYINPATGAPGMTQDEWKSRDKSLGLTRPDGEAEAEEPAQGYDGAVDRGEG